MNVANTISERVEKEYLPRPEEGAVELVGEIDVSTIVNNAAPFMILGRTEYTLRKAAKELREAGIHYDWKNEGGAWKRDAGLAIRIWAKLREGQDISQREFNVISKVLTVDAKRAVNSKKAGIFNKSWHEVMVLPEEAMEQINVHGEESLTRTPNVELSTIHGAKGRECDNVILLTELTDRTRNSMDADPDSEARVFYVGVTRAITSLTIVGGYDGYDMQI